MIVALYYLLSKNSKDELHVNAKIFDTIQNIDSFIKGEENMMIESWWTKDEEGKISQVCVVTIRKTDESDSDFRQRFLDDVAWMVTKRPKNV